jgi:hypothetical protein
MYFIFARFCKFQKLFDKIKAKELLKEGSKAPTLTKVSLFYSRANRSVPKNVDQFNSFPNL